MFDNGYDEISDKQIGIKNGKIEKFTSFKDFYSAYLKQLEHCITTHIDALYQLETRVGEINPSLMFSTTIPRCVESMTDDRTGLLYKAG